MPANASTAATRAEAKRLAESRENRRRRRRKLDLGDIHELNIVAMMDMMTILLIFLLKSYQASSISVNMSEDLKLPVSTTQVQPQDNINVTIAMNGVTVGDKLAVNLDGGVIPASSKEGGRADAFYVGAIYDSLKREVDKQKYVAQYNPKAPFMGRVNVIADRRVPYRTLMEVLYTAGQAELGEYKFMVLKAE
ncbi:MAG TPA: biopolymer transporter ExbD [Anaeromyxobacteraceae bacterium]|nr:biopolymer transporter ExbD [Anaeromyxobacteraceae bacterium]